MEQIADIVREGMTELLPIIKMEAILAAALVGLIFLAAAGVIVWQLVKRYKKGGKE